VLVLTTGVMPILALDTNSWPFHPVLPADVLGVRGSCAGYGRTLLTEQYTMMRFAVFITATFGFFLRKLRFV